jgi:hypothetical protein
MMFQTTRNPLDLSIFAQKKSETKSLLNRHLGEGTRATSLEMSRNKTNLQWIRLLCVAPRRKDTKVAGPIAHLS